MKALVDNVQIAESSDTKVVAGTQYFPPESIEREYFEESEHRATSPSMGEAHYYHIIVDDKRLENAAWFFPEPEDEVKHIEDHVAFDDNVNISV